MTQIMALIEKGKHKECRDVLNGTFIWYILSYRSGYFTSEVNGSEDVIWLRCIFRTTCLAKNLLQVARTMLHVTIAMQLVSWKKNCVRLGK